VKVRIVIWVNRLLSREGRINLLKVVLEGILVYWNSITIVPKGVLTKIRKLCSQYLWAGQKFLRGIHLSKWSSLVIPTEFGGWGVKGIHTFSYALVGKNLWRLT
jgi:hypothetical protein